MSKKENKKIILKRLKLTENKRIKLKGFKFYDIK
jgi:hypothetical protein